MFCKRLRNQAVSCQVSKGLYHRHKNKGYTIEAKRRASRTITKRLKTKDNPKKVLKPEENQGYASILPAVGAKKQLQKPRDMLNKSRARTA